MLKTLAQPMNARELLLESIATTVYLRDRGRDVVKSSCLKFALAASVCLFPLGGRAAVNPNPTGSGNNFYFTPYGSQLDNDRNGVHNPIPGSDNIYDIVIGPNQRLDFDLYIADRFQRSGTDFINFPDSGGLLTNIKFEFEWDASEYIVNDFVKDDAVCTSPSTQVFTPGKLDLTLNGCTINATRGQPEDFIYLGYVLGTTVTPGLFPHDGREDFKTFLKTLVLDPPDNPTQPTPPINIGSIQFQDVELQDVPAPLPLLGVGAAFGISRRLRKRIKNSKIPEVLSVID